MDSICEKRSNLHENTQISYVENKKESFRKMDHMSTSFRVYEDDFVGIFKYEGRISDEIGFAKAKANLNRKRPYPFSLETGVRSRNKVERVYTDIEVDKFAEQAMEYIKKNYPQYICTLKVNYERAIESQINDLGMDYTNKDACITVNVTFRRKGSLELEDGYYSLSLRDYDENIFRKMTDLYLGGFEKEAKLPEEILFDIQYYGILYNLTRELDGERLAQNASLLNGKIGEKIFHDDFTVFHDLTDEECWFNPFWDGDGCVINGDKLLLIDHGKILTGYADKRAAKKYQIPHTKTASVSYSDIPGCGGINGRIVRSDKTIKDLLNGRTCVIPMMHTTSGYNEKGDQTMVVNTSLLFDGEKVLGRLPEFKVSSNLFDVFGKDYIGVGSDNPIIYNDKQLLYRAHLI